MKTATQVRTAIEKSPADVYRFVATEHARNHPRWDRKAVEFVQLDPGPIGVGTRFAYKRKGTFPRQLDALQLTVTDMEPNRRFAWRISGAWQAQFSYTFGPGATPSATAMECVSDFELPVPQLLAPLVRGAINREVGDHQRRIKQMVETGT
ncbi:MAG: hypothetical protein M3077_01020 [Candidatus Dormibacteraeota bacterium]|nr:hypothetical protein [Candidatus Dormibacteraeota bacterium]